MRNRFKIGQAAAIKGISIKALRFYDSIDLLKPAVVDKQTGYRYYSSEQLFKIEMIKYFRRLNVPIAEIKYLFDNSSLDSWGDFFTSLRQRTERHIEELRADVNKLNLFMGHINSIESIKDKQGLYLSDSEGFFVYTLHCEAGPSTPEGVEKFQELYSLFEKNNYVTTYKSGSLLSYSRRPRAFRRTYIFIDIDKQDAGGKKNIWFIPSGVYLCVNHHIHDFQEAANLMLAYIHKSGIQPAVILEQEAFLDFMGYTNPLSSIKVLLDGKDLEHCLEDQTIDRVVLTNNSPLAASHQR